MFREMRRKKQRLSDEDAKEILKQATSGVLALGGGEYPYAVPLSYVYDEDQNALYFHCANTGLKIELINACDKASFCVIAQDLVVPQEITTYFRSVIAFGHLRILNNDDDKRAAIEKLGYRYDPQDTSGIAEEIRKLWNSFCVIEMKIDHLSGKEAIELVRERRQKGE